MTYEDKSTIVIEQLRADRDRLLGVFEKIRAEINTMPCAITSMREIYVRRDKVIDILDKYKAESEEGSE